MRFLDRVQTVAAAALGLRARHRQELEDVAAEASARAYRKALDDPFTLDPDGRLPGNQNQAMFRGINSNADGYKDFTDLHRKKLRQLALRAYHTKGIPENLINIALDFIIGDGLHLAPDQQDETFGDWLNGFWTERENDFACKHGGQIAAALIEGELALTVQRVDLDGHVAFGLLDGARIIEVQQDAGGRDAYLIVENPLPNDPPLIYVVLNYLPPDIVVETGTGSADAPIPPGKVRITYPGSGAGVGLSSLFDGACFSLALNRISGARRGKPDLLSVLDYSDLHDEIMFRVGDRARVLTAALYDVTVTNPRDQKEIKKIVKQLGLDKAPSTLQTIAHSDRVEIDVKVPVVGVDQIERLERILRLITYGAKGYPEAFSGAGDDTNRATLAEQNSVPARRLLRRQGEIKNFYKALVMFGLTRAILASALDAKYAAVPFSVIAPEIGSREAGQQTAALASLANGLSTLTSDGTIRQELASSVFVQAIRNAGFTIDEKLTGVDQKKIAAKAAVETSPFGTAAGDQVQQTRAEKNYASLAQ